VDRWIGRAARASAGGRVLSGDHGRGALAAGRADIGSVARCATVAGCGGLAAGPMVAG